jgi:pilus assembly protein CpaF
VKEIMQVESQEEPIEDSREHIAEEYFELKTKIHSRLLDLIDLSILDTLERGYLRSEIRALSERILAEEEGIAPLNSAEREKLFSEILDEVLGFGPLEPFLQDPKVSLTRGSKTMRT